MWYHIFPMFRRQPGKSVLVSLGFFVAACALILLSATTQTAVVRANQIISQSWRPTYDLVVLPPDVHIPPGQTIPPDYLEGYGGGISMEQYTQIKRLAGVEVAAPIAYIGYIAAPTPRISFPTQNFPAGYYQLNWTLTAFNGQKQLVEYQESLVYHIYPCELSYNIVPFHPNDDQSTDCTGSNGPRTAVSFYTPDSGTFLLAAVDPAAENQLVHLSQSITDGRMLTTKDTIHEDQRVPAAFFNNPKGQAIPADAIPLLIHRNLPGQISLTGQLTQLVQGTLSSEQIQKLDDPTYRSQLPNQTTIFQGNVPLFQSDPQGFTSTQLVWDGQSWQVEPYSFSADNILGLFGYALNFYSASKPTGLTYQPITAPDGHPAEMLVPTGAQGPEVTFRPLLPLHTLKKPWEDLVYTSEYVGQFSDQGIAAQFSNPLNWLPENTYTAPPVVVRYDAQGQPVTPTTLLPTTNQAGYIVQPPLALTTLAAGQQLVGDKLISAIRVRVAGVNRADDDSWKQIQQVAGEIEQTTHLPVVITLGSSPRSTLVYVPGLKQGELGATQDIAPVGWVEERWIAVGVSVAYVAQLGETRLLLIGAVLVVHSLNSGDLWDHRNPRSAGRAMAPSPPPDKGMLVRIPVGGRCLHGGHDLQPGLKPPPLQSE